MRQKLLYVGMGAAFLAAAMPAYAAQSNDVRNSTAQTGSNSVETLVITGSRIANTHSVQAVVLDSDDITLRNNANTVDLLRGLPGLDLIQPGGPGGVTELFIRGAESNFAIVTIDGIRVNDTTNSRGGSFDLSGINPDDIERIEILKGPLSAIYGSDALAGALNIVTKKPAKDLQGSLRASVGSDGYKRSYASVSGTHDNGLGASISAARLDAGEPVKGSTSVTDSVRTSVQWAVNEQRHLELNAGYVERERTSYPTSGGGLLYAASDALEAGLAKDINAQFGWREQASENLALDLQISYFNREEDLDIPDIPDGVYSGVPAMTSSSEMERQRAIVHGLYSFTSNFTLALGVDYEKESGRNNSLIDYGFPMPSQFDLERSNIAVFAEGHYKDESGLNAFISSRLDKPDDRDRENSSKLAISYPIFEQTRVGVSWGNAFKLPSFYAVGDSLVGNEALLAETSETVEVFLQQSFVDDLIRVHAVLFQSDYEELIDFDFATFKLVNRESVAVKGGELEVIVNPSAAFEVGIHVTQSDYDVRLNSRAEWRGGMFVEWNPANNWQGRLHLTHTGKRPSASSETGDVTLAAYERVDAVVVRHFSGFDISLGLDNLFDKEYQDEVGFPAVGRSFRVGASIKL